jgi:hypothetical protein
MSISNKREKMKFTLELQDAIKATLEKSEVLDNKKDFLKEGSIGVYTDELIPLLLQLPRNPQKLFWILVGERDEYNQVHKSRKEMGSVYMKNYYKTNFSVDINKLIELEMVSMIGFVPTISPFLVQPKNSLQMKKAIQSAWAELVPTQADDNEVYDRDQD